MITCHHPCSVFSIFKHFDDTTLKMYPLKDSLNAINNCKKMQIVLIIIWNALINETTYVIVLFLLTLVQKSN